MRSTLRSEVSRLSVIVAGTAAVAGAGVSALVYRAIAEPTVPVLAATVAVAGLASAALTAPVVTIIARRMTLPLERLAANAASFAAGNLQVRARLEGSREMRSAAESFNRMADDIASALQQVSIEEHRKTQFVSDVSHELRTPLTAIRGAAETLLDGDVAPDDQERFLSTIAAEAERLTRLANDLLTLQRIEGATGELPIKRIAPRVAADRAAAMLEPLIEARGVTLAVTGAAPDVLGDADRIQQVLVNLIDNASRMVGAGGSVRVDLSSDDRYAILTVSDNGPGIADENPERLFDRFYRADSSRTRQSGGAGLGLAIVRAIVTAHAGTIEACNLPEGGSQFTVRLPVAPR